MTQKKSRFKAVTICGSMRFYETHMLSAAQQLSLAGWIVLMPFVTFSQDEQMTDPTKAMLDEMHKQKIDMSDAILVINPGGYIGPSTGREIRHAISLGKQLMSIVPIPDSYGEKP